MRPYKAVVVFDTHAPLQHDPSIKCMMSFIKDYKPDELIFGGDIGDFGSLSRWDKDKRLLVEGRRIVKDMECTRLLMEKIVSCSPRASRVFIEGNHEDWVNQYVERHSEVEGLINIPIGLKLREGKYKHITRDGTYKLGKLTIAHGWWTGRMVARDAAETMGTNILFGHAHKHQVFSKNNMDRVYEGIACPCLCKLDMAYMQGKPTNWSHGFAVVEVRDTGDYNCYIINCIKGKCSYGGKVYA